MRIALISTPFVAVPPRSYGGTELVVAELAEGLVEFGHDVELFATGDSHTPAALRFLFARAQWPPEMLADLNHVSWAMRQVTEQGPFDIVHAHSAVALACARLVPEVPLVYTLHHERDEQLSAFYAHCPDAHYIAISEDQRRREIPLQNVEVIHHGLDPDKYQYVDQAPGDYVCFVGRFSRVKGPHTAIDAARHAGVPIRVAGEVHPPDAAWAAASLRDRLAQPHVTFLGTVGLEDKAPLLCNARAVLAPIEWNEPFGLIIIEAMLSGCPIVAFGRGSVPELVEDGVTGFVARSFDHMVELIRPGGPVDHFDRLACRERAVARFSRTRMVADHVRLYERVRHFDDAHVTASPLVLA
ncbi:MAG TPA: glycosyltransferase family 4 protein [Gemmatimonadaceae bacterium]